MFQNYYELKKIIQNNINTKPTDFIFNKNKINISSEERRFCAEQIFLRQKFSTKFPNLVENFDFIFPNRLSCEQSSSEQTAKYKANLINNISCSADLTGGLGIDSLYISQNSKKHFYCEINENICKYFEQNVNNINNSNNIINTSNINICNISAYDFLNVKHKENFDLIYIDPDRRDKSGKRRILLEELSPNILELHELLEKKSKFVLIKLSPIFDISQIINKLNNIKEIHVVSVENECKELLVLMHNEYTCTKNTSKITNKNNDDILFMAVNILKNQKYSLNKFSLKQNSISLDYSLPQKYIYEPNSSLMKLGFWGAIANQFNISKLHKNSNLFTSNKFLKDFNGRIFELISIENFNKESIKKALNNTQKANITVRNFPYNAEKIKKKLSLSDGGEFYLFATTLLDNNLKILVTKKINNSC